MTVAQETAARELARETLAADMARLERIYDQCVPDGPARDEAL